VLPGLSGGRDARGGEKGRPRTDRTVVSTVPRPLARAKADEEHCDGQRFLAKPFDIEEIVTTAADVTGPA
jgi:hypothetical protein